MSSIQAGDVVVCVDDSPCRCGCGDPSGVSLRGTYRVSDVLRLNSERVVINPGVDVRSAHHPQATFVDADRFRKIEKADDKDFIAQIKACRPKHDRVPHNVESDRG